MIRRFEQLTREFRDGRVKISMDAGTPVPGVATSRGRKAPRSGEFFDSFPVSGEPVSGPQVPAPSRGSAWHLVVCREAGFESRVAMVGGKVVAEWRRITVSEKQWKFGGYLPKGGWRKVAG